uniref:Kinesin-like protein n=1 Tax=Arcella intermedia TaxID=1963864 RepID=A0A6B2KZB5_9EUKA|eukprot:TRINITY_DN2475_c0_g1_i2.p1 TRINITY_DN2475_c0_g1~~TRINITY_DN2475_c0_g1_i2.p1  ORF type:complete len:657 (+),score=149.68 TRINITY_DN2475_c0_g1_i2:94-2064(+)
MDQGLPSGVTVAVRVRPLTKSEKKNNPQSLVQVFNEHLLTFDSKDLETNDNRGGLRRRPKNVTMRFDKVFDQNSTSLQLFDQTTKHLVDEVLMGYNCTCFAYGATGAGKTFTMIGNAESPGVMVLTMQQLFNKIRDDPSTEYQVRVSYLEIYNETLRDLLVQNSTALVIRDTEGRDVIISGLSYRVPTTAEEVLAWLEEGNTRRSQSSTEANSQSSRSHAILQVIVEKKVISSGTSVSYQTGKFSLVDLAGSERAAQMRNTGQRLVEGANINKSLLALGNCITALAGMRRNAENGVSRAGYVPFRGSKLTRLLKDSLSGNCKTVMIANVSPSFSSYEDTWNTLQYSYRAKNITMNVFKNEKQVAVQVSQYKDMLVDLQEENKKLKQLIVCAEAQAIERVNAQEMNNIQVFNSQIQQKLDHYTPYLSQIESINQNQRHYVDLIKKKELQLIEMKANLAHEQLIIVCAEEIEEIKEALRQLESQLLSLSMNALKEEDAIRTLELSETFKLRVNKAIAEASLVSLKALLERIRNSIHIRRLEVELEMTRIKLEVSNYNANNATNHPPRAVVSPPIFKLPVKTPLRLHNTNVFSPTENTLRASKKLKTDTQITSPPIQKTKTTPTRRSSQTPPLPKPLPQGHPTRPSPKSDPMQIIQKKI